MLMGTPPAPVTGDGGPRAAGRRRLKGMSEGMSPADSARKEPRVMKIRVLIVDDFPLIREGFAHALRGDPAIEIVGQADNGRDALRMAAELRPDVMVLDLYMPEYGGMMGLERLHDPSPN